MPFTPTVSASRLHPLAVLLARCLAGQLAETQLNALADLFEEGNAAPDERAAFARFYLDALQAEEEVNLPKVQEMREFFALARV